MLLNIKISPEIETKGGVLALCGSITPRRIEGDGECHKTAIFPALLLLLYEVLKSREGLLLTVLILLMLSNSVKGDPLRILQCGFCNILPSLDVAKFT